MLKVISFCLWGNEPKYNIGAIKNAILASKYYPEFECWFYIHKESVSQNTINELNKLKNVKIIFKSGDLNKCKPMCWRFEPIDDPDVEILLSRDTDTRILHREKLAVDEWLLSGKTFHIMRDHPDHNFTILGGMFGTKKIKHINKWLDYINNINQIYHRDYDQDFLNNIIYPHIKNDCIIHSSFRIYPNEIAKPFPINYEKDYRFVGEYVYENESRSLEHVKRLIQNLNKLNK